MPDLSRSLDRLDRVYTELPERLYLHYAFAATAFLAVAALVLL